MGTAGFHSETLEGSSVKLNVILVTYDLLNRPEQEYQSLFMVLGATARRVHSSAWVMITPSSAADVRNGLQDLMDPKDRLLVVKVDNCAYWNTIFDIEQFIRENELASGVVISYSSRLKSNGETDSTKK